MKKYYYNGITNKIESYNKEGASYELRGILLAYGDAITTGFNTKEEAEQWSKEWKYNIKTKTMEKII